MKSFKKIIVIIPFILGMCMFLQAQNELGKTDDLGRIALFPYVSDQIQDLTPAARDMLTNKLRQVATKNGLAGGLAQRFVITANVAVLDKEITPSAPPMHVYNLEVMFYIVDAIDQVVFSTVSKNLKGVGKNETKAYMQALKNVNANDPELRRFVETGKEKIIEYYNSNCDFILKKAQATADQKKYQEAIFQLMSIPEICKECYMKGADMVKPMYIEFANNQCEQLLINAKAQWSGEQNNQGASKAAFYLGMIDPDAECIGDAKALVEEIKVKIKADEDREWDFKVKQWDDQVDIETQKVAAYKEIGMAWASSDKYPYYNYHYNLDWLLK